MTIDFWAARWKEGRIGFHEGAPNAFLQAHKTHFGERRHVLVPLCGKTEDLAYLAGEGHAVIGVEAVEAAVVAFFAEHGVAPEIGGSELIRSHSANGITILNGDIFVCTMSEVGAVDALYDRAALVALPRDLRPRYVRHLRSLLSIGAKALVVSFEYPEGATEGPPYSVSERELRELYDGAQAIELVDSGPVRAGRLHAEGVPATELCFAITL